MQLKTWLTLLTMIFLWLLVVRLQLGCGLITTKNLVNTFHDEFFFFLVFFLFLVAKLWPRCGLIMTKKLVNTFHVNQLRPKIRSIFPIINFFQIFILFFLKNLVSFLRSLVVRIQLGCGLVLTKKLVYIVHNEFFSQFFFNCSTCIKST